MATIDVGRGQMDSNLVELHRSGDPRAFEALYNAHYHQLVRLVRRNVRQNEAVEDIAQEAFARAYAAIEGLRNTERFYPWLTMIARRLIVDYYRQRSRISPVADLDPGQIDDAPEGLLLAQQDHADVSAAMERIRGRHREVLILREHMGMTYEQIAAHLGVPLTTVPPLLHRARLALRREYLLITEGEGTASFAPLFFLVVDGLRRMRDRVVQMAAYLPDPHTLGGSMMAMAVGVGAILAPIADAAVSEPHLATPPTAVAELPGIPRSDEPDESDWPSAHEPTEGSTRPVTPYTPDFSMSPDAVQRGREADRHMPFYLEPSDRSIGPTDLSIGADPDTLRRDAQSSLGGDYGWMEQR